MKNITGKSIFLILFCAGLTVFTAIGLKGVGAQSSVVPVTDQQSVSSARVRNFDALTVKASQTGKVRVIVGLDAAFQPEASLGEGRAEAQRELIRRAQDDLLGKFQTDQVSDVKRFEFIPFMALEVNAAALAEMRSSDSVISIQEDELLAPSLAESTAIVGAPNAWNAGFSGAGRTVAVMDTGVDKYHSFFGGRVVSEACFSTTDASQGATSNCPGGAASSVASDSGLNCNMNFSDSCSHGTHVAGIAAGRGSSFSGVARDAKIIAIQVFTKFTGSNCGGGNCVLSFTSDQIRGLERVYALRNNYTIDAVNVSIGGGRNTSNCDADNAAYKAAIDNLRAANIATIIASGNSGYTDSLAAPACISTAVSVGSSTDGSGGTSVDGISSFSNSASFLTILAPGESIVSSVPGGGFETSQGTSMAAPHVAGAWAVVKQKYPNYTVDQVLQQLITTGKPITDTRNNITKKRIRVDRAVGILPPPPTGPCALSTPIAFNQQVNAQLQNGGCTENGRNRARYSFYGVEGQPISIALNSAGFDTYLYLYDSTNDLVAENDDIITYVNSNSRIPVNGTFALPSTGMFYIVASSYDAGATGNFSLLLSGTPVQPPATARAAYDFDGDGKSDVSVFRPANGAWYIQQSNNGFTGTVFGQNGDLITPADFDGDGKTDVAVFRNGAWYRMNSSNNTFYGATFGQNGDLPRPADFDGDGKADINVFRPSNGAWYRLNSSNGAFVGAIFGQNGDKPLVANFDGDNKADIAVFRPSAGAFYWLDSSTGTFRGTAFGLGTDIPTMGDYDGDGKTDVAVFRPSNGAWYRFNSSNGAFVGSVFGQNGDVPVAADYDGDGKTDIAVFRNGNWYYLNSSNGGFAGLGFGLGTDAPVPAAFR